jgi:ABC-type sugar transport system ATPase subunit
MALLTFDDVTLVDRKIPRDVPLLRGVSFGLEAGEWLAVLCLEAESRWALARVATGIFVPQSGHVLLDGEVLPRRRSRVRRQLALCDAQLRGWREGHGILPDYGAPRGGRRRVDELLAPLAVPECVVPDDPEPLERARASLAGALEHRPRGLIVEGPVRACSYRETTHIRALVREIANQGTAVLMTTDDVGGAAGADRVVSLSHGEMRGKLRPHDRSRVPSG